MKKTQLTILLFFTLIFSARAEFGIWASAVYLNVNGSPQFYNTQKQVGNPNAIGPVDFGANLGSFGANGGLLKIGGAEINTSKTSGGNVCGGTLYYTVYLQGSRPAVPAFSAISLGFFCNCNGGSFSTCGGAGSCNNASDQKFQNVSQSVDLTAFANGNYTLEIYYAASGEPSSTGCTQVRLDNNAGNNYTVNFTITSILAINFSGLSGSTFDNAVKVRWGVQNDLDVIKYEVQKSENGLMFYTIGSVQSNRTSGANLYFYIDYNPTIGSNYYRIKIFNTNSTISLSNVTRLYYGKVGNTLFIYPNPAGSELTVRFAAVSKGNYQMSVFGNNGQKITTMPVQHDGNDRTIKINLPVTLSRGVYRLFLIDKVEFYKQSFLIK